MKKVKLLLLIAMVVAITTSIMPGAYSSSDSTLNDANIDLEFVYTDDGDDVTDVSNAAENNDGNTFEAFGNSDADTQYLYLGADSPFETAFFLVERELEVDEDEEIDLTWEYSDGSDWKTLDIEEDKVDNFEDTGTLSISFDIPSSWDEDEFEDEDAYWIRAELEGTVEDGVLIEQISAMTYNLSVTVTDHLGNEMENLDEDNIMVFNINSDNVTSWINAGNGEYMFSVNTDGDEGMSVLVDVDGYMEYAINVSDLDEDVQYYKIQLTLDSGCNDPFVDLDRHWAQNAVEDLYCRGIIEGDGSTLFMVNSTVSRVEFLKMAMMNSDLNTSRYAPYDVPFNDVDEDEWYYEYVAAAYELDVIDGDSYYYPENSISRAEAATILVRLAGKDTGETATAFSDVDSDEWYAEFIRSATDYEVVVGYIDNTFRPERDIARSEAAEMVNNAYKAWYND